ncbi:MAG: TrkH family potassium uptake protein [Clostridia bacterium]|nr:TrkH family potassium uptake protein [Clostridia bacterium]
MNYKMIRFIIGWILIFEAIFLMFPAITAIIYGEKRPLLAFMLTVLLCATIGLLLVFRKPRNTVLYSREGFVIVSMSWIVLSLFGAIPIWLSGAIPNYIDALFETVSGFTTTGASIVPVVESLPKSVILWRSFTHFVGGMGVLVFIMAFIPLSGGQNMHIMKAESPGPSVSKLVPRVRTTALILYSLYIAITLIQIILLLFGGMTFFDAINTALATAGTGGFGIKNDSFASFSPYIQIVVTVFMLLFSLNFSCYYLAFRGRIKDFFNSETRCFLTVVAVAIALITLNITLSGNYATVDEALRHAAFSVASIISTTGFATEDFNLWPALSKSILVLLMFIGACAGSTGGGIKISRLLIYGKNAKNELGGLIHTGQVKKVSIDGKSVDKEVIKAVNTYMAWYILIFVASLLLISVENHDPITNFTAIAATINNIGPGLELVGPTGNFAFFTVPSKLVLIFDMLAGRLELFPLLLLFTPSTWKK